MMLVMLALLAAADRPVVVSSLTTPQLVEQCRGKDDDPAPSFCSGYIIGTFDTLSRTRQICPASSRASTNDMVATVRKYLRKRGKRATGAPAFVVRDALRAAFPCPRP